MGLTIVDGRVSRGGSSAIVLREAITSVSRAIEDLNWTSLSIDERAETTLSYEDRKNTIRRARMAARTNPLAIQASALLVNYVLGEGITLTAANRSLIARVVDEFWESPVNQEVFTGHQAMSDFIVGAWTDGAQYLVFFPDKEEGTVELGWLDPLFVEDVIHDPENVRVPLWYKVRKPTGRYDFDSGYWIPESGDEFVYYRHWRNDREPGGKGSPPAAKIQDGLVYPARRGKGKFGQSSLAGAVDWLRAHKDFMEDRATITRAAAAVAWRKKRKNSTPGAIAAEVDRLRSSLQASRSGAYDTNPPAPSGATIVENENSTMEWVKTDTGGQAALADERILRMMAGSAMGGIPNHYFGDEANANLATATAMELPLLKAYQNWQTWLARVVDDVILFVLEIAHEGKRIGERDRESRYTDRAMTSEKVIDQYEGKPSAQGGPQPAPGHLGLPQGGPQQPKASPFGEADITVHVTGGDKKKPGAVPSSGSAPGQPDEAPGPQTPGAVMVPPPPAQTVAFSTLEKPTKPSEPVDWYVDVDFPPIVQRDIKPYLDALKVAGEMLPGVPDSQKLVTGMMLTAFGVNDLDSVMDRLFPALPEGQKPSKPALLGPGQGSPLMLRPGDTAPPSMPGQEAVREAMSPLRVRRILSVVREAQDALDAAI